MGQREQTNAHEELHCVWIVIGFMCDGHPDAFSTHVSQRTISQLSV
jgi:hypothetical protein